MTGTTAPTAEQLLAFATSIDQQVGQRFLPPWSDMTSYELEPEVAGGIGPATEWGDRPNEIIRLDYQFDDWLGDDLITTTPAVLATAEVRDAITAAGLTGVEFAPVIVSRSELCEDLNGGDLPEWTWMQPVGQPGIDDFWADGRSDLTLSERALADLNAFNLANCVVSPA